MRLKVRSVALLRHGSDHYARHLHRRHTAPTTTEVPALRKVGAVVGPGAKISLGTAKKLPAGKYAITVRDRSKVDNFHLSGPGVNRKTGVAFRGKVTPGKSCC